jgi:hypothetical protein
MSDKPRPYVTAAFFCERVLQEIDGSLSIIRVADKITFQMPPGIPAEIKPAVAMTFLLSLKSGPVVGDFDVTIRVVKPSGGQAKEVQTIPIKFLGQDQGQNYVMNVTLGVEEFGLYWFEVVFDEQVLTRTPLVIVQQELTSEMMPQVQTPNVEP